MIYGNLVRRHVVLTGLLRNFTYNNDCTEFVVLFLDRIIQIKEG